MAYGTQILIGWAMFKDWLAKVFGGGIVFDTLAPQPKQGYVK